MQKQICQICKKEFLAYKSQKRKFCNRKCSDVYKKKFFKDRFFSKAARKKMSASAKKRMTRKWTEESKEKLRKRRTLEEWKDFSMKGFVSQQRTKQPTSIEKIVYDYLKEQGIIFETQELINGKFLVDAYIPSLNTVIEVDGKYWHSLERVVKKDKAENAYLTKCGFNLIRLTEEEVRNGKFQERMMI